VKPMKKIDGKHGTSYNKIESALVLDCLDFEILIIS